MGWLYFYCYQKDDRVKPWIRQSKDHPSSRKSVCLSHSHDFSLPPTHTLFCICLSSCFWAFIKNVFSILSMSLKNKMEGYRVASIIKDEPFFFCCALSRCRPVRRRNVDGRMIGEEELGRILHWAVFAELTNSSGFLLDGCNTSFSLVCFGTPSCLTVPPAVDWPLISCNGPALCVSDVCPLLFRCLATE